MLYLTCILISSVDLARFMGYLELKILVSGDCDTLIHCTYQCSFVYISRFPAGIWCENDVGSTSMRRDDVASTLIRRHFGTKCPLGYMCGCFIQCA